MRDSVCRIRNANVRRLVKFSILDFSFEHSCIRYVATMQFERSPNDQFIIIASDGVWEFTVSFGRHGENIDWLQNRIENQEGVDMIVGKTPKEACKILHH